VKVSANVPRVALSDLRNGVSDLVKVVIAQGKDPANPNKFGSSRSEWVFWVCCEMVRAGCDDDTIYAVITDPDYGISAYVRSKGARAHKHAVRQIRRARERAVNPLLQELNDEYALVESVGGKTRIMRRRFDHGLGHKDFEFLLVDGFKQTHNNRFVEFVGDGGTLARAPLGDWWIRHLLRRTYKEVTFAPAKELPEDVFNLWTGFAVEPGPGDCSKFLAHLRENVCRGVVEHYEYLVMWMAKAVQCPGEPGQVAVVLRGRKGIGKGFFATQFGVLWGRHFKHITNPDHVVGKFNAQLKEAALVFADEAFYAGSKRHEQSLKTLITEDRFSVELKGVDARQWPNCVHLVMASNEDWVIPATHDERRYFVLDCGEDQRRNRAYFEAIAAEMKAGGYRALLHHLLSMDLSGFDVTAVPDTNALQEQKELSLAPREQWILTLLEDGALPNSVEGRPDAAYGRESGAGRGDGLYDHARQSVPALRGETEHILGRGLREWGVSKVKPGARQCWVFPPLAEMRRAWEARFGPRDWQGGIDATWAPPSWASLAGTPHPQEAPASER
jgi:hypothetical protein